MQRSTAIVVLLASVLLVGLPRWLVRSQAPYNWDAASFTLAVDGIDLAQHRPHPPPAVAFVLAGRLLRPLVGGDAHAALVLENVLFAVLSCLLIFAIALEARGSPTRAWLAWLVFATSVQHAFNTSVAEVYMSELASTLLVAWLGWRALAGSRRALVAMGLALALSGAFRLTGMVFMAPLAAWVVARAPVELKWKQLSAAAFAAGLVAWLGPLIAVEGASDVIGRTWLQLAGVSSDTSVLGAAPMRQLNRNLRDVAYSMATGIGVLNVAVLPFAWVLCRPTPPGSDVRSLAALWLLPGLLFFIFVHMGKIGYTLLLLPVTAILVAHTYAAAGRIARMALVVGQIVFGSLHFLAGAPPVGPAIGEGRLYREKTFVQKVLTESRTMLSTTVPVLRGADLELRMARAAIDEACPGGRSAVLVAADGDGFNWRRAMQAFPEHRTVRIAATTGQALLIGHEGRFETSMSPEVRFSAQCAVVWLLPGDRRPPGRPPAAAGAAAWPAILRPPVRLVLSEAFTLVVDP